MNTIAKIIRWFVIAFLAILVAVVIMGNPEYWTISLEPFAIFSAVPIYGMLLFFLMVGFISAMFMIMPQYLAMKLKTKKMHKELAVSKMEIEKFAKSAGNQNSSLHVSKLK